MQTRRFSKDDGNGDNWWNRFKNKRITTNKYDSSLPKGDPPIQPQGRSNREEKMLKEDEQAFETLRAEEELLELSEQLDQALDITEDVKQKRKPFGILRSKVLWAIILFATSGYILHFMEDVADYVSTEVMQEEIPEDEEEEEEEAEEGEDFEDFEGLSPQEIAKRKQVAKEITHKFRVTKRREEKEVKRKVQALERSIEVSNEYLDSVENLAHKRKEEKKAMRRAQQIHAINTWGEEVSKKEGKMFY